MWRRNRPRRDCAAAATIDATESSGTPFCSVQTTLSRRRCGSSCGRTEWLFVCFVSRNTRSYSRSFDPECTPSPEHSDRGAGYGRAEAIQRVDVIFVGIEQIDRLAALGDQRADDCARERSDNSRLIISLLSISFATIAAAAPRVRQRRNTNARNDKRVFARARDRPPRLNASDASSIHSPCGKARNATLPMSSAYRNMANVYGRMSWNLTL